MKSKDKVKSCKWVKKWACPSRSGGKDHVVSVSVDGNWGCDCSVWKFKREICQHIDEIQEEIGWKENDVANQMELLASRIKILRDRGKTEEQIDKELAELGNLFLEES